MGAEAQAGVEVLSSEQVEQPTFGGEKVLLHKERWRVDGRLSILRKYVAPGGPPVVLVHGFAQNRYTWHLSRRSMSAWLAAHGFDVFNLELRGHGHSRGENMSDRFEDYVRDVVRAAEVIGEPAFFIGHSLGGATVYAAASHVRMRGVIGIGALFRFAQANRLLNVLCKISTVVGTPGVLSALNVRTHLAGRLIARLYSISDIAGYAFPISGWAPGSMEPDLLAERLEKGFDWTSLQVWLDMARWGATGRFDYEDAWSKTEVPVMVIAGDLDHLMLPEDAREAYDRAASQDKTFLLLDDYTTGHHWGHLDLILGKEAPRVVWPAVLNWMQAH